MTRRDRHPQEGIRPSGSPPGGTVLWRTHIGGRMSAAANVTAGTAYIAAPSHGLTAVDLTDGSIRWTNVEAGFVAPPAVVGDTLYSAGSFGVFALDTADGSVRWRKRSGLSPAQPVVANGLVHTIHNGQCVRTLDAVTGRRRWTTKYRPDYPYDGALVLADGILYAGTPDGHVLALAPVTGKPYWKQRVSGCVNTAPLVHGGTLYVNNGRGEHVLALDSATGTQLWRTLLPTPFGALHTTPAIDGSTLYVGCRDGRLWALDAATGAVRWHVPTGGRVDSSPYVLDGTVYFGSEDGHLWAVDAENGRVRWKVRTAGEVHSSPVVVNGVVYVGSFDGHLYAISASPPRGGTAR
ncbi:outer membrane protein assembly factor BamB family protein [Streptomyces sp. NPDC004752]